MSLSVFHDVARYGVISFVLKSRIVRLPYTYSPMFETSVLVCRCGSSVGNTDVAATLSEFFLGLPPLAAGAAPAWPARRASSRRVWTPAPAGAGREEVHGEGEAAADGHRPPDELAPIDPPLDVVALQSVQSPVHPVLLRRYRACRIRGHPRGASGYSSQGPGDVGALNPDRSSVLDVLEPRVEKVTQCVAADIDAECRHEERQPR